MKKNKFNVFINNIVTKEFVTTIEYNESSDEKNEILELDFINAIAIQDDIDYLGETNFIEKIITSALDVSHISSLDLNAKITFYSDEDLYPDFTNRTYIFNKDEEHIDFEFGVYEKKNDNKMEVLDLDGFCQKHKITLNDKNEIINDRDILNSKPLVLNSSLGELIYMSFLLNNSEIDSSVNLINLEDLTNSFKNKIEKILEMVREVEPFNDEEELLQILSKKEIKEIFNDVFVYNSNDCTFEFILPNDVKIKIIDVNGEYDTLTGDEYPLDNVFCVKGEKEYRLDVDTNELKNRNFDPIFPPEYFFDDNIKDAIEGILMTMPKTKLKKKM